MSRVKLKGTFVLEGPPSEGTKKKGCEFNSVPLMFRVISRSHYTYENLKQGLRNSHKKITKKLNQYF
jgi:hypothetical protein